MLALALQNTRTGEVLADNIEVAFTRAARKKGLLGRDSIDPSTAMVLSPCCAVHTAFMRFKIDIVFLDHEDTVVQIVEDLAPWRIAVSTFAHTTVEFAGGSLRWRDIVVGDRLCLTEATQREAVQAEIRPAGASAKHQEGPLTHPIIVWSGLY